MSKVTLQSAIGRAVRARRLTLGVSQEDFADSLQMHRTQYGAIEQGRKDCQLSTLMRLAQGLNMPLWELVRDIERQFSQG